ncbi:uncharacterized protein LOC143153135 [Ptiloglossa arizonensis]|uniref:uncharacterized protein LOC143153135 n=1 Tax=Ptiloglossa arizonensis TaxID=3350558 RepID=UPI003FA0E42D
MATGNLELQHLDLSYNYLTNDSLKKLIECLRYQIYILLGNSTKGLLHVLLEGGNIKREGDVDWSTYEELMIVRQNGDSVTSNDAIREFVSEESEILRKNIKIPKTKQKNSNSKARSKDRFESVRAILE